MFLQIQYILHIYLKKSKDFKSYGKYVICHP